MSTLIRSCSRPVATVSPVRGRVPCKAVSTLGVRAGALSWESSGLQPQPQPFSADSLRYQKKAPESKAYKILRRRRKRSAGSVQHADVGPGELFRWYGNSEIPPYTSLDWETKNICKTSERVFSFQDTDGNICLVKDGYGFDGAYKDFLDFYGPDLWQERTELYRTKNSDILQPGAEGFQHFERQLKSLDKTHFRPYVLVTRLGAPT
ncbi:hypothetical protein WJX73_007348 [Symbiochloris irregularis]|uniref:Uncharacterized protein n=1 Tax=Symbiochloris irregularis TaxID=706552 RepID=A0AAW1NQB5_9CHLO